MGVLRNTTASRIMSGRGLPIGVALVVAAAFLVALMRMSDGVSPSPRTLSFSGSDAAAFDQLEAALAKEVQMRRVLAERVAVLDQLLSSLQLENAERDGTPPALFESAYEDSIVEDDETTNADPTDDGELDAARFNDEALLSMGIEAEDVDRLHDRWVRYELEREIISNNALRDGWFFSDRHRWALFQSDGDLRKDLGDLDYDRYLYARGKPNRLIAGEIFEGSAASDAGLRPGDVILKYADKRVFNPGELLKASSQEEPGRSVAVEILRNGAMQTVYMEMGPLGVIVEHRTGELLPD